MAQLIPSHIYAYSAQSKSWRLSVQLQVMGSSPSPSPSPSPQNKDSSPTRVHCRTRVLHHCRYCIKTETASVMISSPFHSHMISLSGQVWLVEKFGRGYHQRGRFVRVGWVRTGNFCDFSTYKRNGARYNQGYYWTLIGNRMSAFDWYQNQRPWMTLNWPRAVITRCFTLHICLSEPTTKIWMNIDPYYQRQKCRPKIAVSSGIKFMRIFPGVRWGGGVKWGWGRFFWRFSTNMNVAISRKRCEIEP